MNGTCERCYDRCTYVAAISSDVMTPKFVCVTCTLQAIELQGSLFAHEGKLQIEFLPLDIADVEKH